MNDFPTCSLLAGAGVRCTWNELPALRKNPGVYQGQSLARQIRTADEQTVAATAAVARAVAAAGWQDRSFAEWAVLAAPRAFGRARFLAARDRYAKLGPKSASPQIVPTISLHALASTLGIAFDMHGPHYGVSGRDDELAETLLAGLALVESEQLEGVWIVVTELDPEPDMTLTGDVPATAVMQAAALALAPSSAQIDAAHEIVLGQGSEPPARTASLVDWLESPRDVPWQCAVAGIGGFEIRRRQAMRMAG